MKPVFVTTSWDDGHVHDIRLAALLKKYGIKGTFYIAPNDHESPAEDRLTPAQIKELSGSFEIGAHTMSHARLPLISDHDAKTEINESKKYLENIVGVPVTSFCYPRGEYRKKHVEMVRQAGFLYARTVRRHSIALNDPPLQARTTVNTYNHFSDLWSIAKFAAFNPVKIVKYFHWDELAKARFDKIAATGGQFHLWGHSWEIEAHGDWEKLESVLAHIAHKSHVHYVTNGEYLSERPKKILLTVPYFPPYQGGVQVYAYNIAKKLQDELGWEVHIATSGTHGGKIVHENYDGLNVSRLPYWFSISNTPINPLWPFMLRRMIKENEYTVINAQSPVPFMADMTAIAAGDIPLVVTYHTGSMKKKHALPDAVIWFYEHGPLHLLLHRADFIICPSDFVRFGFLNYYAYKSTTITPGVDMGIFKPGDHGDGARTILFVAGLTRSEQHKGLPILIKAFASLHKEYPDVRLMIVGEGNMRKDYEASVRKLGLQDFVCFRGRLGKDGLVEAYQQSDIFVLPSLSPAESFGMVLIEAMASGKAVIGSNAGGIPLVIDNEINGLLVKSGDSALLAETIKRLLDDPALAKRLSDAGYKKAVEQYNWCTKAEQYSAVFKTIPAMMSPIVQIVAHYPPNLGGMEVVAKEISLELARRGNPVTVFTSDVGGKDYVEKDQVYHVYRLHSFEAAHTPFMWMLLPRLLTLPRGSILHVHVAQAVLPEIAYIAAKIRNFPLVLHFHLDIGPSGAMGMVLPFYKKYFLGPVMRGASKVIAFSNEQSLFLQKTYRVKPEAVAIIPNGIAYPFFDDHRPLPPHEPLRILSVSRLQVQKRVERLIEAASLTKANVQLNVVGDGEDRQKLEALAKASEKDTVVFKGKKFDEDLLKEYHDADVFAIASDIEGMPLVVLEAMANGLPIVATNVPGTRELVAGTGILIDEPYPLHFAETFERLSKDHSLLNDLSKRSMEKAKHYSWEKLVGTLIDVYKEIGS